MQESDNYKIFLYYFQQPLQTETEPEKCRYSVQKSGCISYFQEK